MTEHKTRILQVLDPSHKSWVQGGVFADLRKTSPRAFNSICIYLPAPNSFSNLVKWFVLCIRIRFHNRVLFSSLTPLENYSRFPLQRYRQKVGLWFTHKDGTLNKRENRALKLVDVVFLHSKDAVEKFKDICRAKPILMLAAIDPKRFNVVLNTNSKVVWVGTPVERKRPELVIELAKQFPETEFKIIGKNWTDSSYWSGIVNSNNLSYVEFDGPLTSEDLKDCRYFLMTSRIEGGPMPLMEALAAGLIPVSTDTGFVRDLYEIAKVPHCLIVDGNLESLTQGLKRAFELESNGFVVDSNGIKALTFQRLSNLIDKNLT